MNAPSGWTSVRARPGSEGARDAVVAALFRVGAQGVHEDGASIVTHFPPSTDLAAVHDALTSADDGVTVETTPLPDIDWSQAWRARIVAHDLGALTISPPWLADPAQAHRTIVIDPGMAFGTGDHATTRGVVRLLPGILREGDVVADLGAGSAVLSIAAAKLGAARVFAIELDGEAIPDAEANVAANGVDDLVHVFEADAAALLPLVGPVRLVLANIISSALVELLPHVADSLTADGEAILSGILLQERDSMLDYLHTTGWRVTGEDAEDIWWSVSIARG